MTTTYVILIAICIAVSSISKAVMDTIKQHYDTSIFKGVKNEWWNLWFSPVSWKCKYKTPLEPSNTPFYYLGFYSPMYKEKFPFSTTVFVFTTDAWHFFQFLMLTSFQMVIALPFLQNGWVDYIVVILFIKILSGFVFESFYSKIFKK